MNKPFNCFIGRYQCPHKGHQTIFSKYLIQNEPVLIMIRDVPTDDKNPFTSEEVKSLWETIYKKEIERNLLVNLYMTIYINYYLDRYVKEVS